MRYTVVYREWIGVGNKWGTFGRWSGLVILDRETGLVCKGVAPLDPIVHRLNHGADRASYTWELDPGVRL